MDSDPMRMKDTIALLLRQIARKPWRTIEDAPLLLFLFAWLGGMFLWRQAMGYSSTRYYYFLASMLLILGTVCCIKLYKQINMRQIRIAFLLLGAGYLVLSAVLICRRPGDKSYLNEIGTVLQKDIPARQSALIFDFASIGDKRLAFYSTADVLEFDRKTPLDMSFFWRQIGDSLPGKDTFYLVLRESSHPKIKELLLSYGNTFIYRAPHGRKDGILLYRLDGISGETTEKVTPPSTPLLPKGSFALREEIGHTPMYAQWATKSGHPLPDGATFPRQWTPMFWLAGINPTQFSFDRAGVFTIKAPDAVSGVLYGKNMDLPRGGIVRIEIAPDESVRGSTFFLSVKKGHLDVLQCGFVFNDPAKRFFEWTIPETMLDVKPQIIVKKGIIGIRDIVIYPAPPSALAATVQHE